MLPPEVLGRFTTVIGTQPKEAGAYAQWLDDPALAISDQLPDTMVCPECGAQLNLARLKNNSALQNLSVSSVSLSCGACASVVHFDRTAESDRAGLTWIDAYRRD
jgi:transcription elongation factor Elf1